MKIMIKSVLPICTFNLFWILGLLHIGFYSTRPYRHYRFEDLVDPSPDAVFMVCILYSIYFLIGNVLKFTPFWAHHRYNAYLFLSTVLIFQSFIACMGAMHAPPYWAAFIINCMFLLFAHLVLYPLFALWRKYSKKHSYSSDHNTTTDKI
jgi:hypothetical protein